MRCTSGQTAEILREGLRTLRALVEGIADNAAYDALVELAQRIQL
jgi:hypothetical protein